MFKNRSVILLISLILAIVYAVFVINEFMDLIQDPTSEGNAIAGAIATMFVLPHIYVLIIAIVFNLIAFIFNARWSAILSGFLFGISGLLMILYAIFVLPSMILSFFGARSIKKIKLRKEITI